MVEVDRSIKFWPEYWHSIEPVHKNLARILAKILPSSGDGDGMTRVK